MPDKYELPQLSPLELNRIIPLDEASRVSSLSKDALRDNYADKILQLSPKRQGIRLGHALMLGNTKKP